MKILQTSNYNALYLKNKTISNCYPYNAKLSFGINSDMYDKKLARDCAVLAYNAYPNVEEKKLPYGYIDETKLFSKHLKNTLKAKVFLDTLQNRVFIAYSGTYNLANGLKNATSMLFNHIQPLLNAALYLKKDVGSVFKDKEIIVVGHSAGGMMAQYVAAKENIGAITYASAGLGRYSAKLGLSNNNYSNIVNYVAEKDLVTNPFFENIGITFQLPIKSHSLNDYLDGTIYEKRIEKPNASDAIIGINDVAAEILQQVNKKLDDVTYKLVDKKTYKNLIRKFFKH